MIEAGSIGIKAVWVDSDARQSADRFYADMKRKRDEAMSLAGGASGTPGGGGQANPGAWRSGGQWGGNNVWVNPGGWRGGGGGGGGFPSWMTPSGPGGGGGGGGGQGGGFPSWLLGWRSQLPQQQPQQQQGFPSWMMGMQSQLPQQQQIPPWLLGWRSPINPAAGGPPAPSTASRSFFNVRPMAAAYLAIRGTREALREMYRAEDQAYTYRAQGPLAALEDDAAQNQSEMANPIGRWARGFLARDNMTRRFFTSDEDKRESIDRARSSVKDTEAGRERLVAAREATSEVSRHNQRAELFTIRDSTERRLAQSKNAYDNTEMQLDNRLAAMRYELALNTDPRAVGRLKAGISATARNNAEILYAAGRARQSEDAQTRRDAVINSRGLQSDVEAAKLEYQDRPGAAAAQRIFGKTREAFEKGTDKEGAQDILRIGRFELMNLQKEAARRGVGEQFDPSATAFGVRQTGKEDSAELSEKIGELIQAINNWMPGLK